VPREGDGEPTTPGATIGAAGRPPTAADEEADPEELAAQLDELRRQLVSTPVEVVVANHAYGLFELAAIHLSRGPAGTEQARLAIDALGVLVEGLAGQLGEAEPSLVDALAQIRLAFVQVQASTGDATAGSTEGDPGSSAAHDPG
jgi:hypothetical protein